MINTKEYFVYSIPINAKQYIIYASLKRIAFIGNSALVNVIADNLGKVPPPTTHANHANNDFLSHLTHLGFFNQDTLPNDPYSEQKARYDAVVLFLTNDCNLRCTYCYASSGEHQLRRRMTWDVAKATIDRVMSDVICHQAPNMTLAFHGGGEPTLHKDVLMQSVHYARSLATNNRVGIQITGAFNGAWSASILQFITNNFTELSLSFDGLPSVQNSQRPLHNRHGSFTAVAHTLRTLDTVAFPYGIRATVTNESVANLAEGISFICENFHPRKIQVEPVFLEGRAKLDVGAFTLPDIFIEQFIQGFRVAKKHGIELFYSGARLNAITQRFCLAACRALVVTPDGDVSTCFETYGRDHPLSARFMVGYYENGRFNINESKLRSHIGHTVDKIAHCNGCFCRWHCAGDCAVKTWTGNELGVFAPTTRCYVNQELTKFLLLERIREAGGWMWVDRCNDNEHNHIITCEEVEHEQL